jgi:hypothetical protein
MKKRENLLSNEVRIDLGLNTHLQFLQNFHSIFHLPKWSFFHISQEEKREQNLKLQTCLALIVCE